MILLFALDYVQDLRLGGEVSVYEMVDETKKREKSEGWEDDQLEDEYVYENMLASIMVNIRYSTYANSIKLVCFFIPEVSTPPPRS